MVILDELLSLRDEKYAVFQSGLIPNIPRESILGVRVPELRKLVRRLNGTAEADAFLADLPHRYYDENMLHSLLLSGIGDYEECLSRVEIFLPYVDNWAVCDLLSPNVFRAHRDRLAVQVREWSASSSVYTCRFGLDMLMTHFLDDGFRPDCLEIPASVRSGEYYVRMAVAWFFATALAKQWDASVPYLEKRRLDSWTHNKTIQKARESFRVTREHKDYLYTLRIGSARRTKPEPPHSSDYPLPKFVSK